MRIATALIARENDLIRLGKRANPTITDDGAALAHGATQFKVNFDQLRKVFSESDWAKKNILAAVAGNEGDGTSGVRQAVPGQLQQFVTEIVQRALSELPSPIDLHVFSDYQIDLFSTLK